MFRTLVIRQGGNQVFRLNANNQLMQYDQCLYKSYGSQQVKLTRCESDDMVGWNYYPSTGRLSYSHNQRQEPSCLQIETKYKNKIRFATCEENKPQQKFIINNSGVTANWHINEL